MLKQEKHNLCGIEVVSADEFSTITSKYTHSQGLYALLFLSVNKGVHSLSARSFKVRHGKISHATEIMVKIT